MSPENTMHVGADRMDRRSAIKWMLFAVAAVTMTDTDASAAGPARTAAGYGTDPDLLKEYKPGDLWPLTFNPAQRAAAAALCDVIIPTDAKSPGAASVGVHDFIDEWISAPYPGHAADRQVVLDGLTWLDAESQRRFQNDFARLAPAQQNSLCLDICSGKNAKPELKSAAQFFKRYRDLTAGGFYTTREGMIDIGYTGNVALASFDGPPVEVLQKLGLA